MTRFRALGRRRRRGDGLREALERAELYVQAAPAFLVVLDREQRVQLINAYGSRVLGYAESELVGRNWYDVAVSPRDRERLRGAFAEVMAGTRDFSVEVESTLLTRGGEERIVSWRRTLIHGDGDRIVGTLSAGEDVTDRRRAERALAHLASHDQLTGLPNRLLLEDRLGSAVARARAEEGSVALAFLDIDDFRLVNESLGHGGGDELLRQVGRRLSDTVVSNELVTRHGGDEFLVLVERLPRVVAEDIALATADRLLMALEPPFRIGDQEFEMQAAIGVSLFPGDAGNPEELLTHSNAAMYQAKQQRAGPRRYAAVPPDAKERLGLGPRLRQALDGDEIVAYLQPIVELPSGRPCGFEALVRWHDGHRGVVPPSLFIPYAERTGMIEGIGRRIMDLACAQLARHTEAWVSVNVSAREVCAPGFASTIVAALDRHGVEPGRLVIEVTESAVFEDADRAMEALATIRARGVRLAIDDFGAGYSSLARLHELPLDILKLDRRFLRDVPGDREASTMLAALIEFGRALGLPLVAEGVESADQRDALVDAGCPLAQGYLLGRPAPADQWRESHELAKPAH